MYTDVFQKPQLDIHNSPRFIPIRALETVKSRFIGIEIQHQYLCLMMILNMVSARISMAPLRLMSAAIRFTTVELRMLTMRPRFATVLVWFRPVMPRHSSHAVLLTNRDESEWIGMSVIPRFIPNANE